MKRFNKIITILLLGYFSLILISCSGDLPQDLGTGESGQAVSPSVKKLESPPQSLITFLKCIDYYFKMNMKLGELLEPGKTLPYEMRGYFEILIDPIIQEAQKTNIYELDAIYKGLGSEFYTKMILGLKMVMSIKESIKSENELVSDVTEKGLFRTLVYSLSEKKLNEETRNLSDKSNKLFGEWVDWLKKNIVEIDKALQDNYKTEEILKIVHSSAFYTILGESCQDKKEYDQALASFTKAVKTDPNNDKAYLDRGTSYFLKKEFEPAMADYLMAIKINPKNGEAYFKLACLHSVKKELDNAFKRLREGLQVEPALLKSIETDPDLENLRKDPRCQELLKEFHQ